MVEDYNLCQLTSQDQVDLSHQLARDGNFYDLSSLGFI